MCLGHFRYYLMRLWILSKSSPVFSNVLNISLSLSLFFFWPSARLGQTTSSDLPPEGCGSNVSLVFKVSAVLLGSILHLHPPGPVFSLGSGLHHDSILKAFDMVFGSFPHMSSSGVSLELHIKLYRGLSWWRSG